AVSIGAARLPRRFGARVLGVLGVVSFGFLLFTLATSNPFLRLDPAAPDGRDLNPILQDPALAVHPPILYTGYVGFAVAFAFACAAMLEGKLDQAWARWTRPWTTTAWGFLTCGIALGSFWAYYELGWGGFWFWDPVENASFMPWLVGTELIHSLPVTDERGLLKSCTPFDRLIGSAALACSALCCSDSHCSQQTPDGATLACCRDVDCLLDPTDRLHTRLTLARAVIGMTVAHAGLSRAAVALTTVQSV